MEIKISTQWILRTLLFVSWFIFVGLCIEAGAFLTNAVFAIVKPSSVAILWQQADLSDLFRHDVGFFAVIVLCSAIVAGHKACMFYLIIKALLKRNISMVQPFSIEAKRLVLNLSYLTFAIGLFSTMGSKYVHWLIGQGIKMPDTESLHLDSGDVWIFMAITLLVIGQIFRRGIEIQAENDLTI